MKILRNWIDSLTEAERSLRSQGYVVVYSGLGSCVVPLRLIEKPPQRGPMRRKPGLQQHGWIAAFQVFMPRLCGRALRLPAVYRKRMSPVV